MSCLPYPILGCQLPPPFHLFGQQLLHTLPGGGRSKLLLIVPPGLQQHQPFLLLLTAAQALVGLLVDLPALLQPVIAVDGQLKLGIADPDLQDTMESEYGVTNLTGAGFKQLLQVSSTFLTYMFRQW